MNIPPIFLRHRGVIRAVLLTACIAPLAVVTGAAQVVARPLTRSEAISEAIASGPRLAVAAADTSAAFAQLLAARAFQNPGFSTQYTRSTPQYHFLLDIPFEFPGIRNLRVGSADAGRRAAALRYLYERASVALDADTSYTRAIAARSHASLSRSNAAEADSLRTIAVKRRNAGDASELDVALATVFAGQAANTAATDSLSYLSALLDLQAVLGMSASGIVVFPTDSLSAPEGFTILPGGSSPPASLPMLAAEISLESARLARRLQERSIFSGVMLTAGIETHDPSGSEKGVLPVVGFAIPLPLLNRNRGPIAQARAEEVRATAQLKLVTVQSRTEIARAERELAIALRKIQLDQGVVLAATRVAAMSLSAYREGASPLSTSLEAQRSAREALSQYVDDVAAALIAAAELQVLNTTSAQIPIR